MYKKLDKIKNQAKCSKDNPRSIIIDANLGNSRQITAEMLNYDAMRQVISSVRQNVWVWSES